MYRPHSRRKYTFCPCIISSNVVCVRRTLCNAYAQLGARGVSLIFSSGDGGVSGNHFEECTTFNPTFPSVCPQYVSRTVVSIMSLLLMIIPIASQPSVQPL